MENSKQPITTYLAFMRIGYEGIFESSMKLFKSKIEAGKYIYELRNKLGNGSATYEIIELPLTN